MKKKTKYCQFFYLKLNSKSFKRFINSTYENRYQEEIKEETATLIWSLANGLMPLGGAFGGLFTGLSVEKLGK
jgi:hypothetical protein